MALYLFRHNKTGKIKEVVQTMTDPHKLRGYTRIFINPHVAFNSILDPFDAKGWNSKTAEKKGVTIGEMQEYSEELSNKRAQIAGSDPIKDKVIDDYERKTHKKHPSKIPKVAEIDLCKGKIDKLTY